MDTYENPVRVMALHALAYCERLFYLEEVEEIRVADDRVYAGRRLHESLDEEGDWVQHTLESSTLGLLGKVDALRRRDGTIIPYEHKRGRSCRTSDKPTAWDSDRLQIGAYAILLEETLGESILEGRIRYHADKSTVRISIDDDLRAAVLEGLCRARNLRELTERPPITDNERLCVRCSLAPVCLPEEGRKSKAPERNAIRMFPAHDDRQPLHVLGHGTKVGRRGYELRMEPRDGESSNEPIRRIRSVTLHGYASMSSQALDLCASQGVAVHWFGAGGWYIGSFWRDDMAVQRRIRQYEALRRDDMRLQLARHLVKAKTEHQLRFSLRALRQRAQKITEVEKSIEQMRTSISKIDDVDNTSVLLGLEGMVAKSYFGILPKLVRESVDSRLGPKGRSRRPPRDPFNALLSFGYGMLLREVHQAIRAVGLDAAFGFYHQPRSAAAPLTLDIIELFRVSCVDMAVLGAINRGQFDPDEHFIWAGPQVWLSKEGKKKAIMLFEQRLSDQWKHPVLEYSLSYRRAIELEVRLLEKEWSGEPGLFARMRIR